MGDKILKTATKVKVDSTLEYLLASLKSPASKRTYEVSFRRFLRFTGMKNGQQILDTSHKKLTELVIGFVLQLAKEVNPNTVPTILATVRSFLEIHDIDLKWKKIKKFYPEQVKLSGQNAYSTEQVQKMLSVTKKLQHKALIHFHSSTACRSGAICDVQTNRPLCIGDLRDMPHGCQQVRVYTDTIKEYITFLTPEAVTALELSFKQRRTKGEILTDESPVFVTIHGTPMEPFDVKQIMKRIVNEANVRGQMKNGRYPIQLMHGFRKRWNTIMKLNNDVNDNAIEKMMGHENGLDGTYLQITEERLFEEFYKGITDLTIDSAARDQIKIRELEKKAIPNEQEIFEKIMPQVRKELGLEKITPEIVDTLSKEQLQNLVKNFVAN